MSPPEPGQGNGMSGTRHSEERVIALLKQAEAGLEDAELCRHHGDYEQILLPLF